MSRANILIVESRLHREVADLALDSTQDVLKTSGVEFNIISVHDLFSLTYAVGASLEMVDYTGVIALGCNIKEVDFSSRIVFKEIVRGLNDIVIHYSVPVGLGVFSAKTLDKAKEQAPGIAQGAAISCLQLLQIKNNLGYAFHEPNSRYDN